jgi:hypothetical protein
MLEVIKLCDLRFWSSTLSSNKAKKSNMLKKVKYERFEHLNKLHTSFRMFLALGLVI